jgi:hypothetical protein
MPATERVSPWIPGVRVGRLAGSTEDGEPLVDYPGNSGGPLIARVIVSAGGQRSRLNVDSEVLLVFEDSDATRPVIVGFLEPSARKGQTLTSGLLRRDKNEDVRVDGKMVELRGQECVVLSCGKSSITMFADGRVIVKGTRLLSRASESNKIKGGTIALN